MPRFVALSGPSCIGKGPLFAALEKFHPELAARLQRVVLFNDRAPRPGEADGVDYHFRPRSEIEALAERPGFLVVDVRGDLQALETDSIRRILDSGHDALFEGNPFVVARLRDSGAFERFETLSVFLAPLSRDEILYLKVPERRIDLAGFVTDVQRRKLLHRTKRQKVDLSLKDLENIEKRAASAIVEMREAFRFDRVIPLHDGEGNDNWDAFYYPIGSARLALEGFAALLRGHVPAGVETWEEGLVP
jgi:guanylate kinase